MSITISKCDICGGGYVKNDLNPVDNGVFQCPKCLAKETEEEGLTVEVLIFKMHEEFKIDMNRIKVMRETIEIFTASIERTQTRMTLSFQDSLLKIKDQLKKEVRERNKLYTALGSIESLVNMRNPDLAELGIIAHEALEEAK